MQHRTWAFDYSARHFLRANRPPRPGLPSKSSVTSFDFYYINLRLVIRYIIKSFVASRWKMATNSRAEYYRARRALLKLKRQEDQKSAIRIPNGTPLPSTEEEMLHYMTTIATNHYADDASLMHLMYHPDVNIHQSGQFAILTPEISCRTCDGKPHMHALGKRTNNKSLSTLQRRVRTQTPKQFRMIPLKSLPQALHAYAYIVNGKKDRRHIPHTYNGHPLPVFNKSVVTRLVRRCSRNFDLMAPCRQCHNCDNGTCILGAHVQCKFYAGICHRYVKVKADNRNIYLGMDKLGNWGLIGNDRVFGQCQGFNQQANQQLKLRLFKMLRVNSLKK